MKAIEQRLAFAGVNYDADRHLKLHRERIRTTKKCIDNSLPLSYEKRNKSPTKKVMAKRAAKEKIYKENFFLAKRIFDIMEGDSDLTTVINDTRHLDNHPGTMNFKQRLEEAQRIHYHNMLLASRLNSVKPYYKAEDLSIVRAHTRGTNTHSPKSSPRTSPKRKKKTRFMKELEYTLRLSADAAGGGDDALGLEDERANAMWTPRTGGNSSGLGMGSLNNGFYEDSLGSPRSGSNELGGRPRTVILEYTKIQDNRVLDIAVVKEPFRDRYIIFGKDIEDGQRFELKLTSEDVSNILDGDILVTSVDNVEVWMALLNKVDLDPVAEFSKLAFFEEDLNSPTSHQIKQQQQKQKQLQQKQLVSQSAVKAPQSSSNGTGQVDQSDNDDSDLRKRIPSAPESSMRSSNFNSNNAGSRGGTGGGGVKVGRVIRDAQGNKLGDNSNNNNNNRNESREKSRGRGRSAAEKDNHIIRAIDNDELNEPSDGAENRVSSSSGNPKKPSSSSNRRKTPNNNQIDETQIMVSPRPASTAAGAGGIAALGEGGSLVDEIAAASSSQVNKEEDGGSLVPSEEEAQAPVVSAVAVNSDNSSQEKSTDSAVNPTATSPKNEISSSAAATTAATNTTPMKPKPPAQKKNSIPAQSAYTAPSQPPRKSVLRTSLTEKDKEKDKNDKDEPKDKEKITPQPPTQPKRPGSKPASFNNSSATTASTPKKRNVSSSEAKSRDASIGGNKQGSVTAASNTISNAIATAVATVNQVSQEENSVKSVKTNASDSSSLEGYVSTLVSDAVSSALSYFASKPTTAAPSSAKNNDSRSTKETVSAAPVVATGVTKSSFASNKADSMDIYDESFEEVTPVVNKANSSSVKATSPTAVAGSAPISSGSTKAPAENSVKAQPQPGTPSQKLQNQQYDYAEDLASEYDSVVEEHSSVLSVPVISNLNDRNPPAPSAKSQSGKVEANSSTAETKTVVAPVPRADKDIPGLIPEPLLTSSNGDDLPASALNSPTKASSAAAPTSSKVDAPVGFTTPSSKNNQSSSSKDANSNTSSSKDASDHQYTPHPAIYTEPHKYTKSISRSMDEPAAKTQINESINEDVPMEDFLYSPGQSQSVGVALAPSISTSGKYDSINPTAIKENVTKRLSAMLNPENILFEDDKVIVINPPATHAPAVATSTVSVASQSTSVKKSAPTAGSAKTAALPADDEDNPYAENDFETGD